MTGLHFLLADGNALLERVFASWVQELQIRVESVTEKGAVLRMPFSERLCREGGTLCGQSLMALADTSMVIAVSAASGRYRPMTTVDLTTHMMKPVSNCAVLAETTVLRLGRTMAFGQALLRAEGNDEPIATVTMAYALLPE